LGPLFAPMSLFNDKNRRKAWPAVLVVLIFVASGRKSAGVPDVTDFDKVVHFAVFGLLATLVCRLGRGWKAAAWGFLAAAAYGGLDEWHQSFVPERSSELADWIADAVGAMVAAVAYAGWARYRGWLETPIRFRRRKTATVAESG
jgi:VanZ family protein